MRTAMCLAGLVVVAAAASAGPLAPRRPPPSMTIKTMRALIEGLTAERWGELADAGANYQEARSLAEGCVTGRVTCGHPTPESADARATAVFDLAALAISVDQHVIGSKLLARYLELAPNAPDRSAVERLRGQLDARERVVTIGGHAIRTTTGDADAIILVDGVVVGPSPATLAVTPGTHVAERVTASTYAAKLFETYKTWDPSYVPVTGDGDDTGNVVIAGDLSLGGCTTVVGSRCRSTWTWRDGKHELSVGRRFKLPKGHYVTSGGDPDSGTCTPFEFDVRSDTALTYVRVEGRRASPGACLAVDHVKTQLLEVHAP